jgi:hypothetical protein
MLNSVRYTGFFSDIRNVHWLQALAAATSIVWRGPSRSRHRKSTAYETDIVDPLRASGRLTLKADVTDERTNNTTNHTGCVNSSGRGKQAASRAPPAATTAPTWSRAASGSDFISFPRPPCSEPPVMRRTVCVVS